MATQENIALFRQLQQTLLVNSWLFQATAMQVNCFWMFSLALPNWHKQRVANRIMIPKICQNQEIS